MAFCFLRDIENLKFSFSEKATKIWCNHPQGFEVTMQCQNLEADCTNFCGLLRTAELYQFFIVEKFPLNEELVYSTSVHCFESVQLSRPDDSKIFSSISKKTKYHPYHKRFFSPQGRL